MSDEIRRLLVKERGNKTLETAQLLVEQLLARPEDFAIWGAGNTGICTRRFLAEQSGGRLQPRYIVDNNPSLWGRDNIIEPEEFFHLKDCPKRLIVSVYVSDQVLEQIKGFNYNGQIICLNLTALYQGEDIWTLYEKYLPQLEKTYHLLADDRSRETFIGFLNYIRTLDDRYLADVNGNSRDKLIEPTIMLPTAQEHFVDVGAFTGDTIAAFSRCTKGKYQSVLAFEPDEENYEALCQYIQENNLKQVCLKQMAVGEENGTLYFEKGISESCHILQSGDNSIEVCKLDELMEVQDTTFLKISTNGAELEVLKGAQMLIRRNNPKISTYASGVLLWEIPAYLTQLNPAYKIYYRHYGFGRQAMICYAVL